MIKSAVLVICLFLTNDRGDDFIQLQNDSDNETYHCEIISEDYYVDFTLSPKSKSRIYPEPYGEYTWKCY